MTVLIYWLATLVPCTSITVGTWYLYGHFFDDNQAITSTQELVNSTVDLSAKKLHFANLVEFVKNKDFQHKQAVKDLQKLTAKLEDLNAQRAEAQNAVATLTPKISELKETIQNTQKNLSAQIEEMQIKDEEEASLKRRLILLTVNEDSQDTDWQEAKRLKEEYERTIELLNRQREVATSYVSSKQQEKTIKEKEISALNQGKTISDSALTRALQNKTSTLQEYEKAEKALEKQIQESESQTKLELESNSKEIVASEIEEDRLILEKRRLAKDLNVAEEKASRTLIICYSTISTILSDDEVVDCENAPTNPTKENQFLKEVRRIHGTIKEEIASTNQKLQTNKTSLTEIQKKLTDLKKNRSSLLLSFKDKKEVALKLKETLQTSLLKKEDADNQYQLAKASKEDVDNQLFVNQSELERIEAALANAQKTIGEIDDNIKLKKHFLILATENYTKTLNAFNKTKEEKNTKQETLDKLKTSISTLKNSIATNSKTLTDSNKTKDNLETQLNDVKKTLESLDVSMPATNKIRDIQIHLVEGFSSELIKIRTEIKSLASEINKQVKTPHKPTTKEEDTLNPPKDSTIET